MSNLLSGIIGAVVGAVITSIVAILSLPHVRKQAVETALANDIEARRIDDERAERLAARHDELAPPVRDHVVARLKYREPGKPSLWTTLTLGGSRAYRVEIEGVFAETGGFTTLSLPLFIEPGEHSIHLEQWASDQEKPKIGDILMRFWAPVEGDDTDLWDCQCGRPTASAPKLGAKTPGHWTRKIKVEFDPDAPPLAEWS